MKNLIDEQLLTIIKTAGQIALEYQSKLNPQKKNDSSLVTDGDLAVSNYLEISLKSLFPDYDIFSEENCDNVPKSNKIIVLDPIDGTQSYARKEDSWAILIAFLEDNQTSQAYIFQPTTNKLFFAFKKQGAYLLNLNNDHCSILNASRDGITVSTASPNQSKEELFLKQFNIEKHVPKYSASIKIMDICEGSADIYPNFRQKCSIWDLLAPELILKESGGFIYFKEPFNINFNQPLVPIDFCAVGVRFFKKINF